MHKVDRRARRRRTRSSRSSRCSRAELIVGFARLDGEPIGIVANNPKHLGGVLFVDSADKAARFIWCCDAFNVPLVFLADVPGFMIGIAGRARGDHPPRRQDDHRGRRGDGAEDLGDRAQGVRRRPLRDVRPRVRSRRLPRAADRADRGDGPGARRSTRSSTTGSRRSRTPTSAPRSSPSGAPSTRPTSTSSTSPRSSSSTRSCSPTTCRDELVRRLALAATRQREHLSRRHGVHARMSPTDPEIRAELVATVRRFVERDVLPVASRPGARRRVPGGDGRADGRMGLFGVTIPEEHGGLGLDLLTYTGGDRGAGVRLDVAVRASSTRTRWRRT